MIRLFAYFGWQALLVGAVRQQRDTLPGWLGEVESNAAKPYKIYSREANWEGEMEQLSWTPRSYRLKGFLTDEECDHLIAKSINSLTQSGVVDNATGEAKQSEVRTSSGTYFGYAEDEVIDTIEKRIAEVSRIPIEHQECIQILNYKESQLYRPHTDYFHDPTHGQDKPGGQRLVTILMYLSDVEEGGETVFPHAEPKVSGPGWSECAQKGLAVHPRKGDALMFFSLEPDGAEDPKSTHGSCPVIKGEKWSATKWIRTVPLYVPEGAPCIDKDAKCEYWKGKGMCDDQDNYIFMHNTCKKTCTGCTE